MDHEIQAREHTLQVRPKSAKSNMGREAIAMAELLQLPLQGATAEEKHPESWEFPDDLGQGLQEHAVALAGNELGDGGEHPVGLLEAELAEKPLPVAGPAVTFRVDPAGNTDDLVGRHTCRQKHLADTLGDGDNPIVASVFGARQEHRLGIVHASAYDRRGPGDSGNDPTPVIRTSAAMGVDEVRLERPDRVHELKGKPGIEIPGEPRRDDAAPPLKRPGHGAALGAQQ